MDEYESLSHTIWDCRYHVDAVSGVAPAFGRGVPQARGQKESKVEEGHLMPDHVHMLLSIPPKYAVSQVVGYSG